jgi:hypothetical protein
MRAKMRCDEVTDVKYGPAGEDGKPTKSAEYVRLNAVYGKDGSANASWSKATPSGQVTITISNPDAWGHFKTGGFYFVDFSEATEEG